jgi:hypothetical protein
MFGFRKKAKPLVMRGHVEMDHHLTDIRWNETGTGNGDEHWGYRWVCSCTLMSPASPTQWYYTEELAMQGHREHRALYE